MGEWSGYCSHDPNSTCSNCQTYYVIPNVPSTPRLGYATLLLFESWIGRVPTTEEEIDEVNYLKDLIKSWKKHLGRGELVSEV